MKVTIWNEFIQEKTDPPVAAVYPDGIHSAIADYLKSEGLDVNTATLKEPEHGLSESILSETDVLVWWGHKAHRDVDDKIVERIRKRVGNNALYLSIDIDVLDPAFAPGTGTPEIAGMTTREIVNVIRGLSGLNLISADVVEVAPAYDHAEVTSLAAATIIYELTNLFAKKNQ